MMKIPTWAWITLAAALAASVLIRNASQASYFRAIADEAAGQLEVQQTVLDSVTAHAGELAIELAEADSVATAERLENERAVAMLERTREEARERSEEFSERLRASLDSIQLVNLDSLVGSYELQIASLEQVVEAERSMTLAERLRADQANLLVLGLNRVIAEHESAAGIMRIEIDALRSANRPSFGVRIQNGLIWALAGVAIGVAVGL